MQLLRGETGDDFSWGKGASGEEVLGSTLRGLPPNDWTVVHDVTLDGIDANVDHVVVGPPGIFSLNTKNLAGNVWVASRTFMVNGVKQDYLWKANGKHSASRIRSRAPWVNTPPCGR